MKLTTTTVRALTLPPGVSERTYFDDNLPGFGVRLRAAGSARYVVQYDYGSATRRMTLGAVNALGLGEAREKAKDILAAVRLGQDPASAKIAARTKSVETFGSSLQRYLKHQRTRLKPRSFEEVERHLTQHVKTLHSRAIDIIDRRAIATVLSGIADSRGPVAANRVRSSLSAYFAWLLREGILDANPVINTNKQTEPGARSRVLADHELAVIWRALGDDHYSTIVRLLTLTGARRDEIASLRWSEIELDEAVIRLLAPRTKNKRPHDIPLVPLALDLIKAQPRRQWADGAPRDFIFGRGQGGFADWNKSKVTLDQRIAEADERLAPWVLHDLRRTMSTVMHDRLGISPHIVESVLNHVGHQSGVPGTYNRATYAGEKRRALERWAEHLEAVISGKKPTAEIVSIGRTR
jgi:integrase